MNDRPQYQQHEPGPLPSNDAEESEAEHALQLLGAVDIVEAFTALRHELKLQVRGGRELQQLLQDRLQRIEQRVTVQQAQTSSVPVSDESRQLAEAVAEMEESLQRALEAFAQPPSSAKPPASLFDQFDRAVLQASWTARIFAGHLLQELRGMIEQFASQSERRYETLNSTRRGLELLLARVHRLMQQCEIRRVDVLHQTFDAETMHAVDVVDAPSVLSEHVAEQLRPGYLWRGRLLRFADVRLAR